jgi:hypothetical protein
MHEFLHLVQRRLSLLEVQFALLFIHAALDDKRLQARGGIAKRAAASLDDVLVALLRVALEESRTLEGPERGANADGLEVIEHCLGQVGVGSVAVVLAGVESAGIAGLGEQLLGPDWVIPGSGRPPIILKVVWDNAAGNSRMSQGQRLVDRLVVDGQTGREPYPLIMPGRFFIPLVGEVQPEGRLDDGRLEVIPLVRSSSSASSPRME